ncbi:MAG: sigma-70 family RNA polymerase sigma factor [Planctomycetes bacterium]|nr:sigma-70 family RNA polymerase sigma factor [Planctomycetota bacterium]
MTQDVGAKARDYERRLVTRACACDALAVRELVDLHKDRLFAFIWRMVRNHHDAEEICQDAFLKAFASLDSFSVEYRFSTWLFTIGYRICLNRLRRNRTRPSTVDLAAVSVADETAEAWSLESADAAQLKEAVWQAVDQLTPPQRAAILLFYRQELCCHEIARILEVPVATVKSHLHRARTRLRKTLEQLSDQELRLFRNLPERAG